MTDDTTTTDDSIDEILTGNSHLMPSYRPDWGNSNPNWDNGQIMLEGELDFPADQPAQEVCDSLRARASKIAAIVSHDLEAGEIRAYPWNGPGYFRLNYDPSIPNARVTSITVFDREGRPASHKTIDELESEGRYVDRLKTALNPNE